MGLLRINLVEDRIGMRPFGEPQSKVIRVYAQIGQYHTIV